METRTKFDQPSIELIETQFIQALRVGNLEMAKALYTKHKGEEGFVFEGIWIESAALSGNLPTLQWVLAVGDGAEVDYLLTENDSLLYAAGTSGSIAVMEYLANICCLQGNEENFAGVVSSGDERAIAWFRQRFLVRLDRNLNQSYHWPSKVSSLPR